VVKSSSRDYHLLGELSFQIGCLGEYTFIKLAATIKLSYLAVSFVSWFLVPIAARSGFGIVCN